MGVLRAQSVGPEPFWLQACIQSQVTSPPQVFSLNMSAVVAEGPLNKRMRSKTTPAPQEALPEALVLDPEASVDAKKGAYLITFPHPRHAISATGIKLVAPSSLSKTDIIARVRDAFAHTHTHTSRARSEHSRT